MQIIIILETLKDFFSCKLSWPQIIIILKLFKIFSRLQNCHRRKSYLSRYYSKIFSAAKLSKPQIIFILKLFKDFFACKIVLAANHHYPEIIQNFSRLQNCHRRKSYLSRHYSKIFLPAKLSKPQIIFILKLFKDFFACKIVLAKKSSLSWKYSKILSPAKLSQPQIIFILKLFKDFFACKIVLAKKSSLS